METVETNDFPVCPDLSILIIKSDIIYRLHPPLKKSALIRPIRDAIPPPNQQKSQAFGFKGL
jgi:hypothetical protein